MKKYIFKVPYVETVSGEVTLIVEADSLDEATKKLNETPELYWCDSEEYESLEYEELWGDVRLDTVTEAL